MSAVIPRLLSRSLLSVFVSVFACVSLSLSLSPSHSSFLFQHSLARSTAAKGVRSTQRRRIMEYFISRAFAARGARTHECTHTYIRTRERASGRAGVFCNNHVDFCFTERGGSRNRIRMNFVPANVPLFCIFYCCFSINEFKTETRRARARARSSCFGFQRGKA